MVNSDLINSDTKNLKEIKMIPEMLNLLGCNRDNFKILLKAMSYKISEKNNEVFFKYMPKKKVKFLLQVCRLTIYP